MTTTSIKKEIEDVELKGSIYGSRISFNLTDWYNFKEKLLADRKDMEKLISDQDLTLRLQQIDIKKQKSRIEELERKLNMISHSNYCLCEDCLRNPHIIEKRVKELL